MSINTFTALASAARTDTGTQELGSLADYREISIYIDATAVSGTSPSMTVTYESSHDGTTWFSNTVGTAITAVGKQIIKVAANIGKFGRLNYAISGTTPSFTFSAVVEGKT